MPLPVESVEYRWIDLSNADRQVLTPLLKLDYKDLEEYRVEDFLAATGGKDIVNLLFAAAALTIRALQTTGSTTFFIPQRRQVFGLSTTELIPSLWVTPLLDAVQLPSQPNTPREGLILCKHLEATDDQYQDSLDIFIAGMNPHLERIPLPTIPSLREQRYPLDRFRAAFKETPPTSS